MVNPLINGNEDIDLARKMALLFDFQGFDDLVAGVEVGQERSTTNQTTLRSQGQWTRELILKLREGRLSTDVCFGFQQLLEGTDRSRLFDFLHLEFFAQNFLCCHQPYVPRDGGAVAICIYFLIQHRFLAGFDQLL